MPRVTVPNVNAAPGPPSSAVRAVREPRDGLLANGPSPPAQQPVNRPPSPPRQLLLARPGTAGERLKTGDHVEQFLIDASLAQTMEGAVQIG